jgi:hypothetical protein
VTSSVGGTTTGGIAGTGVDADGRLSFLQEEESIASSLRSSGESL